MFIDTLTRYFANRRRRSDKARARPDSQPTPAPPTPAPPTPTPPTPTPPTPAAPASPTPTAPASPTPTPPTPTPPTPTPPTPAAPTSPVRIEAASQLSGSVHPVSLILQPACQPASLLFMILIVETIVVLFSAVHAAYVPFFPALAFLTVYYQMVLILVAGLVCHLSGVLARWHVATATLAVVVITSAAAAVVALALQEWALGHTSTFALFIGQTQLSCLALALFFLRYRYLQQQRYEQLRAQINARLEALQAYIRPHFLFNSLNNLAAMITIDAAKAEQLVLAMAYMLRYVLRASAVVSLGDEMEFLRRYVFIEQARLGDRLRMQWRLPEGLDESSTLPSMIIQPLLENAINHGPGALSDGGRVEVEFVQTTQHTAVYIRNHAPVADAATTAGARRRPGTTTASAEHHQLSIANIRARLQLLYDNQAQLVCQAGASIDEERLWWQTELTIPRRQPSPAAINGEPNRPAPNPSP